MVDGTANNKGSITFDNMFGYGMYTSTGTVNNGGSVIMNSGGTGLYANGTGGQAINKRQISISIPDSNDKALTYGIYVDGGASGSNTVGAEIYIKSNSSPALMLAKAFGVYVNNGSGTNQGTINIEGSNSTGMAYVGTGTEGNTDTLINLEGGEINLTGSNNIGMSAAGAVATNKGTVNVGTKAADGTITQSTNSIGLQTTGGLVFNQSNVNVYSSFSVGLQSDAEGGVITNNGIIYVDDNAANSYAFLSKAGTAVNGTSGSVVNNQSKTDYMRAEGGDLRNEGTLTIANSASYVNAMHVANGGNATNYGDKTSGIYGTINVGSQGATGTNNIGMLLDGDVEGSIINDGIINVYSQDSYGMYVNNENGTLTNNGTINVQAGATGSVALYAEKGTINNAKDGIIEMNVAGTVMQTQSGNITNEGTIELNYTDSTAMSVTGSGSATNSGQLNVDSADSYAMYAVDGAKATLTNTGGISIKNGATDSYAMYGANATITNDTSGTINVLQSSTTAMFTEVGTLVNNGTITLDASDAIGMSVVGDGGSAENTANASIVLKKSGKAMYVDGVSSITNNGNIQIKSNDAYAMYAANGGTATNGSEVSIIVGDDYSSSYAMYGMAGSKLINNGIIEAGKLSTAAIYASDSTVTNSGTLSITSTQNSVSGIYVNNTSGGSKASNDGSITVTGAANGTAYGIYSTGGTVDNSSEITVSAGQAYGIALNGNGTATNSGTITVTGSGSGTSYGMYGSNGASLVNAAGATINVNAASAIGMYATGSGSSIYNYGTINVNGASLATEYPGASSSTNPDTDNTGCTSAGCGSFIQVADGATFVNSGQVISTSALNFNLMSAANSGTFVLAPKGSYIAPEYSGPVTASADIVMEGNKTTYVNEDSFIGTDAGLKLSSGSYLFDAYLVTNEDGNQDVVMTMKEFSDVVDNSSVANFLTNNYTLGTNMDMYSILKSAPDASSFTAAVAGQMGLDIVPSFAKQNMDIVKAVNRHMSQTLFANQSAQDVRAMFDFVYDYREQNDVDMLSGYEDKALSAYALFDRKYNNNFRYGLGVSFTRYESDYDNGSERDEIIAQVLTPLIYTTEGLKAIAMPRLGIGWGEYNRRADGFDNKADTKNYYYGITNEIRKEFDLGAVVLEPTAEFNVLGMYQDSTKEKNGLEVKSANNLSVEGGLGLYARKSFSIKDENDLTLRAGGTWYHEFNNPYQAARARIAGMVGSYQMDSYDAERDRGILTFRMDYKHEGFDFYFEANKFLEESDGYALSAGMGYKF